LNREGAGGDNSSPERLLNEKQWKCSNPEGSIKCNASQSSSTAVEPNAGSAVSPVEEANGMVADISRLDKNGMDDGKDKDARSGMDDEKDKDEDGGAVANVSKSVDVCEQQESSVISNKEDASIGVRVEADSGCAMEGNIQVSRQTQETAHKLSAGPVASSCKSKVVNVDRGIQSGCTIQDKHRVKVEVSELQVDRSRPPSKNGSVARRLLFFAGHWIGFTRPGLVEADTSLAIEDAFSRCDRRGCNQDTS
jgi:hypothetical protein